MYNAKGGSIRKVMEPLSRFVYLIGQVRLRPYAPFAHDSFESMLFNTINTKTYIQKISENEYTER